MGVASGSRLAAEGVSLGYGERPIVAGLDLTIADGAITTIIGPNGCGKSTTLRALARLLRPERGAVLLDGQEIHSLPSREVARRLGLMAQGSAAPAGLTVEDLARRGRYPHQAFLQPPSARDEAAVDRALELTGMGALRGRSVDRLSGGQRQRAWIAMALAQETPLLLLDEPTTYLDVAHALEIVALVRRLNADDGRTVVLVLHDVNEAARVSDRIVAMKDGRVLREGTPEEVLEPDLLRELYGVACDVLPSGDGVGPFCLPCSGPASPRRAGSKTSLGAGFEVRDLRCGYGRTAILDGVSVPIPAGEITAIIGPNACGKSTLLRTCARLLTPMAGDVRLGGDGVHRGSHRTLARRLALLGQGPEPPAGFLVEDLVAAGRTPHQGFWRRWSREDEAAIDAALAVCGLAELRLRAVETLSGGQLQRAWFALTLAQETPVLLLDEPTTFLDLKAQVDLLDLARRMNRDEGRTVVMVLHDLNMAARYADHLVAMKDGAVVATGTPDEVLTTGLLREVFGVEAEVGRDRRTGAVVVRVVGAGEVTAGRAP